MSSNPTLTPELSVVFRRTCDVTNVCTREQHEALKGSEEWVNMLSIGIQEVCEEYDLDLRNCKCGSTLGKRIYKSANLSASER